MSLMDRCSGSCARATMSSDAGTPRAARSDDVVEDGCSDAHPAEGRSCSHATRAGSVHITTCSTSAGTACGYGVWRMHAFVCCVVRARTTFRMMDFVSAAGVVCRCARRYFPAVADERRGQWPRRMDAHVAADGGPGDEAAAAAVADATADDATPRSAARAAFRDRRALRGGAVPRVGSARARVHARTSPATWPHAWVEWSALTADVPACAAVTAASNAALGPRAAVAPAWLVNRRNRAASWATSETPRADDLARRFAKAAALAASAAASVWERGGGAGTRPTGRTAVGPGVS